MRKLPPATVRVVEPDGTHARHAYWDPPFTRDADRPTGRTATGRRRSSTRCAPRSSGGWSPTCRWACCSPAASTPALVVALLAEAGQTGLQTFSIGFESAGGESGDEFEYSDLVARRFGTDHHHIKIDTARLLPAIDGAVAAMSEPMVSHDCVAFYLLVRGGRASRSRSCSPGRAPTRCSAATTGTRRWPDVPRDDAVEAYARVFFDRRLAALAELLQPEWLIGDDAAERSSSPSSSAARARRPRWTRRCASTPTVMLVDDPVKRVDNMTMAWGLEARVPFLDHEFVELAGRDPARAEARRRRQGRAEARRSRGIVPDEVIDRTKGYFPVPAIRQLEGPYLDRVRDALTDPAAGRRGLFRPDAVDGHARRPEHARAPRWARTRCGSSRCWRCGCRRWSVR